MKNIWSVWNQQTALTQLVRYAVVGVVNNTIGYSIYLLITYFGVAPKLTMTLLYVVGALMGYAGHKKITFAHDGFILNSGLRYLLAHFLGYSINFAMLTIFVDYMGYLHQWVQALAIFVVAGFLFLAFKFFVFPSADLRNVNKS